MIVDRNCAVLQSPNLLEAFHIVEVDSLELGDHQQVRSGLLALPETLDEPILIITPEILQIGSKLIETTELRLLAGHYNGSWRATQAASAD